MGFEPKAPSGLIPNPVASFVLPHVRHRTRQPGARSLAAAATIEQYQRSGAHHDADANPQVKSQLSSPLVLTQELD